MCTAVTYETENFYFGRNLDLDYHYKEEVTVTPRAYPFAFRNGVLLQNHYAVIGMATVADGYPLYYDATNEKGLSMAGLNFPGNAEYKCFDQGKDNIAPFELIPWILGQCSDTKAALEKVKTLNIWQEAFNDAFPISSLHWILADRSKCVVLEQTARGLQIYENPVGILTNNPPFPFHMHHLVQHMNVTASVPVNRFSDKTELQPFSLGMGGIGLPGDLSSPSRFVRAAFAKLNARSGSEESDSVGQFFHILSSVSQQRGLTKTENDEYEITLYSSCCNTVKGIYYYTTYENNQISAVNMHKCDLDGTVLIRYPLIREQKIFYHN